MTEPVCENGFCDQYGEVFITVARPVSLVDVVELSPGVWLCFEHLLRFDLAAEVSLGSLMKLLVCHRRHRPFPARWPL